jgi:predicted nucleotidyltransferase
MDATAIVARIGRALERNGLEAVLIGNAGAAIHGAPVTTVDIDFLYRRTPANLRKIKRIAKDLEAVVFAPFYPTSGILRMMNDDETLQVDFMDQVSGVRSFEGIRKRARQVTIEGAKLMVADLSDIIKMKRAAGRARDRAVLEILEKTLEATQTNQENKPSRA